jgi:hypothetical protein
VLGVGVERVAERSVGEVVGKIVGKSVGKVVVDGSHFVNFCKDSVKIIYKFLPHSLPQHFQNSISKSPKFYRT